MSSVKFDTKEPCGSCPYRKDSKLGLWHPFEFENLARRERDTMGAVFGCHATIKQSPPSVCAGWLIKQRDNNVPSIALRMTLIHNDEAVDCLNNVSDGGHELYDSVQEMIEANEALGRCQDCDRYLDDHGECPVGH